MPYTLLLAAACFAAMYATTSRQEQTPGTAGEPPLSLRLWMGDAPGALGTNDADIPTLTSYSPFPDKRNGAAVIVCPGGGYGMLADHEGRPVAEWLTTLGVTGFVLKYRLAPRYHHPSMMLDAARAIRTVRAHAREWGLDPRRIGILGFSAGGHLASTASTHFDDGDPKADDPVERVSSRPDLSILIYPVITMAGPFMHEGSRHNLIGYRPPKTLTDLLSNEKQVTHQTPPAFLVHTTEDKVVPLENSLLYAMACHQEDVPVELHLYDHGPHGFGMGGDDPALSGWPALCAQWLDHRGFLKENKKH